MDIKVVILIKYVWNNIVWAKSGIWNLLAAKCQTFVDISEAQKARRVKFLEFDFYLKRQSYIDITTG